METLYNAAAGVRNSIFGAPPEEKKPEDQSGTEPVAGEKGDGKDEPYDKGNLDTVPASPASAKAPAQFAAIDAGVSSGAEAEQKAAATDAAAAAPVSTDKAAEAAPEAEVKPKDVPAEEQPAIMTTSNALGKEPETSKPAEADTPKKSLLSKTAAGGEADSITGSSLRSSKGSIRKKLKEKLKIGKKDKDKAKDEGKD